MERVSRAFERGETQGFMRILIDRETKQILGASLLGLAADEVIQDVLDLMYAKAPYTTLQRAMHIHPTVAEYLPTMLGSLTPLATRPMEAGTRRAATHDDLIVRSGAEGRASRRMARGNARACGRPSRRALRALLRTRSECVAGNAAAAHGCPPWMPKNTEPGHP